MPHRLMISAFALLGLGLIMATRAPTADAAACTIAVGAVATGTSTGIATSLTITNYDPGTGFDRLLVVGVSVRESTEFVTSITFNSTGVQPLTKASPV